jgi:uncharacterized protein YijF (DUF1287 family)
LPPQFSHFSSQDAYIFKGKLGVQNRFWIFSVVLLLAACDNAQIERALDRLGRAAHQSAGPVRDAELAAILDKSAPFEQRLSAAALERTRHAVVYDPAYERIAYPMGDIDPARGVCSDEVIRAYRTLGVDLQRLVHEDMRVAYSKYPKRWGLARPDSNIDHRRVANLEVFFTRHGRVLSVTGDGRDYRPGEIVTWTLPGNLPHIGIVTHRLSTDSARPLIVHNIGQGPQLEDMLFAYPIKGHFRYGAPGTVRAGPSTAKG